MIKYKKNYQKCSGMIEKVFEIINEGESIAEFSEKFNTLLFTLQHIQQSKKQTKETIMISTFERDLKVGKKI